MNHTQVHHKLKIVLQAFLLLFAVLAIPTAMAAEEATPIMPLILKGSATVNGEPAEIGSEVVAMIDDRIVGSTTISTEGLYGDLPTNRLLITSGQDDYEKIKIYIDGVEADTEENEFQNARPGNTIDLDISTNTNQQTLDNTYLMILAGGLLIIGAIAAMRYRPK
ncbi:hypothetical protein J2755_002076 [Methanohalophilus levihalophilus]|uniref:hypothetical protein n=1 Tax=Methanohalophilus levihalophilus TaxID=1431282 RepID=UPI001AEB1A6F|nr:hypothetical protein [Methanohalophilus levihalophilus]MBP2031128.1 hypothetical protein [Methanohalophilus levihalophilus]